MHVGSSGKKNMEAEEAANESTAMFKKKQFPGLCIPDDQQRAQALLHNKEDMEVAAEALSEVKWLLQLCVHIFINTELHNQPQFYQACT